MRLHIRRDRSTGSARNVNMPGTTRVLVIDDDAVLRKTVRVVLEVAGYDVIEAVDGAAGLRMQRVKPGRWTCL